MLYRIGQKIAALLKRGRKSGQKSPIDILRERGAKIGEDCSIYEPFVALGSEPYLIEIGNHVRITCGVRLLTHDGGAWLFRNPKYSPANFYFKDAERFGKSRIGDNVHIGNNVTILPNITIGDNVIIGAGAVVTKSFPSNVVIAGVPAKVIKTVHDYHAKYRANFIGTNGLNPEEKKIIIQESEQKTSPPSK